MKDLKFPIHFVFKISSFANDFTATDAQGRVVAYVRQKMFKLKDAITIYADESRAIVNFTIKADRWIDFSAAYSFYDSSGTETGKVARKGWASLWKAEYEIVDQDGEIQYHIREENGWVKVMDSLLGQLPLVGALSGYLFNPTYKVTNLHDQIVVRLKKEPSFWGRKFEVEKLKMIDQDDAERIMLGLMMMILLERRRG